MLHHLTPLLTLWNFYLCSAAATDCFAKTWRIPPTLLVLLHLLHPSVNTSLCLSGFSLFKTVDRQGPTFLSTEKLQGGQISTLHDKLLMTPLALLFFPPWGFVLRDAERKPKSQRTRSTSPYTADGLLHDDTHIQFTCFLWNLTRNSTKHTHTHNIVYCSPNGNSDPLRLQSSQHFILKTWMKVSFFLRALIWALLGLLVLSDLKEKFKSHSQPEKKLVGQKHLNSRWRTFASSSVLKGRFQEMILAAALT